MHILMEVALPALAFFLGVGFATGNWPAALVTGLAMSSTIYALFWLHQWFLKPQCEKLSQDWARLGLEMTFTLLAHVVGALAALFVCSRFFGFELEPSIAWIPVAGMVVAFPIIHGTEMALRYFRQLQEKERQEAQLRALATEAELKALKAQINPHFLFNTLNTIAQLIHTDSNRAEETVERLAEMFRYVLNGSERQWVTLDEALTFLDSYLEIERARFGERLRVTREIDPEALDVPVPSLILQPLVENAVRHGRDPAGRIDLTISVQAQTDEVVVAIADKGPGMPPRYEIGGERGHGLRNVDQRLTMTYGAEYSLEISDNEPHGTVVTVKIPMEEGCE
jgi:signal transduction histidine kinase